MLIAKPLYTIFGIAVTPLLHGWLRRRSIRGKEDASRLSERFGYASLARPMGTLVWLHAASVGETQSVVTLVRALLASHPEIRVLITTGTVTSAALVAQQNLPRTIHQFIPVDTFSSVKRFLDHWQPELALWVESEFWPQLLWQAQARHIPMLLVNARISEKTFRGWQRRPATIRSLLRSFCGIYAGSSEDARRLAALGGSDIRDVGNLKFDASALPLNASLGQQLAEQTAGRPIFLAASTHANEEQLIAQIHPVIAQQFPDILTIIVPRHASRGDAIAAELRNSGLSLAQRSRQDAITSRTAIYLADTMGELGNFYERADVVFMGGSLVAHGGQNPLEAARFHNAILAGPHTHNFAGIIAQCVEAEAMKIVADKTALADETIELLRNKPERDAMAQRAQTLVEQSRGTSEIILQHCAELIARSGR